MAVTTWSPTDKDSSVTLSNGNLTATGSSYYNAFQKAFATSSKAPNTGEYYWEYTVPFMESGSAILVGVSGPNRGSQYSTPGKSDSFGISWHSGGYNCSGGNEEYVAASAFTVGDTLGIRLSTVTGLVQCYKNGVIVWTTASRWDSYTPFCASYNGDKVTANFGATAFQYAPPSHMAAYNSDTAPKLWTPTDLGAKLLRWWTTRDFEGTASQTRIKRWTSRASGSHVAIASQDGRADYDNVAKAMYFPQDNTPGFSFDATGLPKGAETGAVFVLGYSFGSNKSIFTSYGEYNAARLVGSMENTVLGGYRADGSTNAVRPASGYTNQDYMLLSDIEGGTSAPSRTRVNGGTTEASATRTVNTSYPASYTVGAFAHGWLGSFNTFEGTNGFVREVIYTGGVLTQNEIDRVEGFIAWGWGRQATLPSNHTYKATAPQITTDPAFTMTQIATPNRVYQRVTTTNGGQSKGRGTIPVTINVTAPGTLFARIRAEDGTTILQTAYALASTTTTGEQAVNVTNVDARAGWFFVDLAVSADGPWKNGTTRVGMGRVIVMAGQSQIARMIGRTAGASGTNADLGVTINPNSSVFATYADTRTVDTPVWAQPADATNYDGTAVAELLRRQVDSTGVNCAVVSHSVGGTKIAEWQPGQTNHTALMARLDAVGGFEAFYWYLGGTDAGASTSGASYKSGLDSLFSSITARNAIRGSSYERYISIAGTRLVGADGNTLTITALRRAAKEWSAANSATYLEPHDVTLLDNVHQDQAGNITLARHLHRAMSLGNTGPQIISGVRSGAILTLTVNHTSGATTLIKSGNPIGRFSVFPSGTLVNGLAFSTTDPVVVTANTIKLTLATDPGADTALDVYALLHPDPSGSAAQTDMIYDDRNTESFVTGRHLTPTHTAITVSPKMAKLGITDPNASDQGTAPGWNRLAYPYSTAQNFHVNRSMSLLSPSGENTGWTVTISNAQASSGQGTPTGNESGVYPDAILKWYIYNGASASGENGGQPIPSSTITISGLNPSKTYNVAVLGSRAATTRNTVYTINGISVNQDNSNNTSRVATFNNVSPDSSGKLVMTWERQSGQNFGYFNAMTISEQSSTMKQLLANSGSLNYTPRLTNIYQNRNILMQPSNLMVAGKPAGTYRSYKLALNTQLHLFSGVIVNLWRSRLIQMQAGNLITSGRTANLLYGYVFPLAPGQVSYSTKVAQFLKNSQVQGQTGYLTVSGKSVNLSRSYLVCGAKTNYNLTGIASNVTRSTLVKALVAGYTLTGLAAIVRKSSGQTLDQGGYNLSGKQVNLKRNYLSQLAIGTYNFTINPVKFLFSKLLVGSKTNYLVDGLNSNVKLSKLFQATTGNYNLTNNQFSVRYNHKIVSNNQTYSLVGNAVGLNKLGRKVILASYYNLQLNTPNVGIIVSRKFITEGKDFNIVTQSANLNLLRRLQAVINEFKIEGIDAALKLNRKLISESVAYELTSSLVSFRLIRKLTLETGLFRLVGKTLEFVEKIKYTPPKSRILAAKPELRVLKGRGSIRMLIGRIR